jgi:phage-related protein
MAEFTWIPSIGFTNDSTPKVKTAKFGDGYSQRVPDGINNISQSWNLQFQSQPVEVAEAIEAFFRLKQGVTSFTWVPPGEVAEVKVIAPKWTKTYDSGISRSLSVTFERVYE